MLEKMIHAMTTEELIDFLMYAEDTTLPSSDRLVLLVEGEIAKRTLGGGHENR